MKGIYWFIAAVLGLLLAWRWFAGHRSPEALSAAHEAVQTQGALLLDVRTPHEYAQGHLSNAINIPVQELPGRLGELGDDRTRPVVVYCQSGSRSAAAARSLQAAGFTSVHDIGPMSNWGR